MLLSDIDKALYSVCDEIDAEYPSEKHGETRSVSELTNLAFSNGVFWDKLKAFLSGIVQNNAFLTKGNATIYHTVPSDFDPNNSRRKCA